MDKIIQGRSIILDGQTARSRDVAVAGTLHRSRDASDTFAWEREIDELVYKLYDLTPEEIKIIEGGK